MEFTFEEKFIFGNQNFIKCYFNLRFGSTAKSECLIADRRGVLYSPIISDSNKIYMHRLKLIDVRNKNLVIRCIHLVQHNKRSYVFLACESVEGGSYCLITYCISNLEIYDGGDNELFSWQILEVPFKIMDLHSLTDATGNSVIILCGSDKRLHVYSLDAQCIIRLKKKSNFLTDKVVEQLLISSEYPETFLTSALPLGLYFYQNSMNHTVHDALLGYSNGIVLWFHTVSSVPASDNENEIIQEIPLYNGGSMKPARAVKSEISAKVGSNNLRRNLSAGDLAKSGELDFDSLSFDDSISPTSRVSELPAIEKTSTQQQQQSQSTSEPSNIPLKADIIENKTLLFDGIVSCLCFYQVPLPLDLKAAPSVESKNKSLQWFAPKPKKQNSLPCVVFGLAGGGTLLGCFDDSERPVAILPGSHKRGGVMALALGTISSKICQDIFFGFHDGTVTLVKFDDSPRPHCKISDAKLSKVHFSIVWEIQITFPVIGLSFGQLLGLDSKQNSCNSDNKGQVQVLKGAAHSSVDCSDAVSEILSDQLAVVTTKSFHLFSLSFGNSANTEKIANIDRFVAQIAPAPDTV